ncbi:MAG: hypothetical protein U1F43_21185 [Myxococcota bacterium]
MNTPLRVFLGATAGAFAALLATQAIDAAGASSSNIAQGTIPFRATLKKSGTAFSGEVDMRFGVWDAESGGTRLWSEEHSPSVGSGRKRISVYAGELVAPLGAYDDGLGNDDLKDVIADATPLWVEVEVRTAGANSYTKLSGRQRLVASPYALSSGQAASPTFASLAVSGSSGSGLQSTAEADVAGSIYFSKTFGRFGIGINQTGKAGPHLLVFGDPGADGGQLRYDTTTNVLDFERTSDSVAVFSLDLDDGTFTVLGQLHVAQTSQDTSTVAGNVTLGSSADLVVDTLPNVTFTASTSNNGIAFGDNDGGVQAVYDPNNDDFVIEKGTTASPGTLSDGSDLFVVDRNGLVVGIKGDMVTGGYPAPTPGTWSNPTTLENNALDKVFQSDSSCNVGHLRVAKNGGKFVSLCVCLGSSVDNGQGYYCFD